MSSPFLCRLLHHYLRGHIKRYCGFSPTTNHKLFAWLPDELEPNFGAFKRTVYEEYERLTNGTNSAAKSKGGKDAPSKLEEVRQIVDIFEELDDLSESDAEVERLVSEISTNHQRCADSEDLCELARAECIQRQTHRESLEKKLFRLLVPSDPLLQSPGACVELVAGAGGREAGLFAKELLSMYEQLALNSGWQFNLTHESTMLGDESTSVGSASPLSNARFEVIGYPTNLDADNCDCLGAYGQLKWEAGVHRVQRIPVTSKQHKIHTSTVAVSVLPMNGEVSMELLEKDLIWEYYRSSGAGGQHVNRTDSAVRLTHVPTGTIVTCQQERSQHINRRLAFEMMRQKLHDDRSRTLFEVEDFIRRSQIGSLERSEKIRTYNFPQDRVTDHRLGRSWNGLHRFMRLSLGLSEAIEDLFSRHQSGKLRQLLSKYSFSAKPS